MAAKKTAKSTETTKSTKAAPEKKPWIGVSSKAPRLGQTFSVVWRVPGQPKELVSLWQEGPEGNFHFTVPPKGSRPVAPLTGGNHAWSIHGAAGEELARVEVKVKT